LILYFLQGFALALPSTIIPSPLKVFLISEALENGWRHTLPAALSPLVTDGPIGVLILMALTQTPDWFLNILRVLGGFFILYLAKRIMAILKANSPALKAPDKVARQSFFKAITINIFNPNPYLFWGVVAGPIVLEAWRQQSLVVGLSFIVGYYITFVCGLAALIVIFATAGKLDSRLNKFLSAVSAVALLIFGLYQIISGGMAVVEAL
jgi:threonine/homoserine/homoserine lactone efflux protein